MSQRASGVLPAKRSSVESHASAPVELAQSRFVAHKPDFDERPRISAPLMIVSIPALNEEKTVGRVIADVPRRIPGIGRVEVVVIDDGSSDQTANVARRAGATVLRHGRTLGVGAAFQTGLAHGVRRGADLIVSIDADGQFDPVDIPELVEPVLAGEAEFATASRFKDASLAPEMPGIKRWGNRMMSRLISRLTGQKFFDVSCGFRCYSRHAALNLHLLGHFTYTQEVFLNLAFKHMRMVEVPLRIRGVREHGKSRVAGNLLQYALKTSRIIFRSYRDYFPLHFFGGLSALLSVPALGLWGFLLVHYLQTGGFSPHKWAGFTGAALFAFGLMMLILGVIGDMLNRQRVYLEELLYYVRARESENESADRVRSIPSGRTQAKVVDPSGEGA